MRQVVSSDNLPKPAGPYSPGIIAGDFVYVSGQGPSDPATGQMVTDSVQAETRQVLRNVQAILEAAGTSLANVVKCNVYLADRRDFAAMNEAYREFFPSEPPARTTVEAHPPVDIRVEIDCVAYIPR
ncbi:MAG TPA: Rid family detoxifying hydrolase [Armatimonadota bacterium]|jgi:2-iminobutanoate/2-iminopropanoate deaminase|nr:Rid family detoxifying hydrolase [Armatimonadota bacterium]